MANIMWISVELIFAAVNTVLTLLFVVSFLKGKRNTHLIAKATVVIIVFISKYLAGTYLNDNIIVAVSVVSALSAFFIGFTYFRTKVYGAVIGKTYRLLGIIVK